MKALNCMKIKFWMVLLNLKILPHNHFDIWVYDHSLFYLTILIPILYSYDTFISMQ